MAIFLQARGKLPAKIDGKVDSLVVSGSELAKYVATKTKLNPNRIRLTIRADRAADPKAKDYVVKSTDKLAELAKGGDLTIHAKDLGPQLGWRTVYLIEYAGPIAAHLGLYFFQNAVYGETFAPSFLQKAFFYANLIHYVKRELETLFVHRFSNGTMPAFNVFKNSFHYWILGGLLPAYFVYAPASYEAAHPWIFNTSWPFAWTRGQIIALLLLWLFSEIANANAHLILRNLRPEGSTRRAIPYGFGFDTVSCPNYYFESLGWLIQTLIVQNWSLVLFWVVGTVQMGIWAKQKHARYKRDFPDYPKDRKAFIPGIF